MVYTKFLGMGYEKFPRMSYKKFLGIGSNIFPGNNHKKISSPGQIPANIQCSSQEFLNGKPFPENSQENLQLLPMFSLDFFMTDSWEFPLISTDFLWIFFMVPSKNYNRHEKIYWKQQKTNMCFFRIKEWWTIRVLRLKTHLLHLLTLRLNPLRGNYGWTYIYR